MPPLHLVRTSRELARRATPSLSTFQHISRSYSQVTARYDLKSGSTSSVPQSNAPEALTGLRALPWSSLIRSLAVLSVASLPQPALSRLIRTVKRHSNWIHRSAIMRRAIRATFYDTFCIGEGKVEIAKNVNELRQIGVRGVILAFAREAIVVPETNHETLLTSDEPELASWVRFNLETIDNLRQGDYLAVRCTGAGKSTLKVMDQYFEYTKNPGSITKDARHDLLAQLEVLRLALYEICAAAKSRGIRILVDAEDIRCQVSIDHIALNLMSTFNRGSDAFVLSTYQMYLKAGIAKLRAHLQHAAENNYILGVKMVRGAFMHTEPDRTLLHDTKGDTDKAYDEAVKLLITSHGASSLDSGSVCSTSSQGRWAADVMLATHNSHSAKEALRLYREYIQHRGNKGSAPGTGLRSLAFAQLKGMADELSLQLAADVEKMSERSDQAIGHVTLGGTPQYPRIGVYKYSVWGPFQECLLYMLRRAEENKDAVARSRGTATVMMKEAFQRLLRTRRFQARSA
ncbi:carbapenem antibiotics biosynthesis protein carD [Pochonia chlamydosporia 170]|uniref:Proline dehydrogenase n=1 Tax=Pochonia chlamydosporia 170 TaxID=1380566 RepID=A0A179F7G6_METCM|nr:carbapenem antibiotics biosynthesis protein carD [Pochonia chlamydosporia 170]OAQ61113.2 carbapenem antibiotics biosynthesis protein carD [Pochonia chlamydosporia 170]